MGDDTSYAMFIVNTHTGASMINVSANGLLCGEAALLARYFCSAGLANRIARSASSSAFAVWRDGAVPPPRHPSSYQTPYSTSRGVACTVAEVIVSTALTACGMWG